MSVATPARRSAPRTASIPAPPAAPAWLARLSATLPQGRTLPEGAFRTRHRWMVALLWAHVAVLPVVSLAYGYSLPHSLVEGAIVGAFALATHVAHSGRRLQATLVTLGLLTCSAVLVHITQGLVEAHFHFFVMVTVLSLYEDWTPFLLSIAYVLVHHAGGALIDHQSVYQHDGEWLKWAAVHAFFITGLAVANVFVWRAAEQVRRAEQAALARAEASERRYRAIADELAETNLELERRATELARSNAELEQFAYVASHDLSEPLRMVTSYLQLLERRYDDALDQDAHEFIGYAVDGASRMRGLIDDLLLFSRAGRAERRSEPVDLAVTADVALRSLAAALEEAGGAVEVEDLPTVAGDPTQLSQLFQNLVANAIKFRGDQPPRVRISAQEEGPGWRVAIADNGIGIDPAHGERIFKMFQRLHTRDAYDGNGIGLALCRKIVERHGGRIWHEPEPGGGSRFVFTLPRETT